MINKIKFSFAVALLALFVATLATPLLIKGAKLPQSETRLLRKSLRIVLSYADSD